MNNLSFPKSFEDKDNGVRTIHWIPVTSRLPKREDNFLISTKNEIDVGHFVLKESKYKNTFMHILAGEVIAWAELPTPYKI